MKQLGFNIHDKYELNNVFKFTADESLKVERSDDIPALANYDVSWFRMPNTNGDQFIEIPNKYISWNEKAKEDGSTAIFFYFQVSAVYLVDISSLIDLP